MKHTYVGAVLYMVDARQLVLRTGLSKTTSQGIKMIPWGPRMKLKSGRMGPEIVPMPAKIGHGNPTCCSKCSRTRILVSLGASGIDFGGPRNPIWEDPASVLNQKFHSIPCYINHRAWHYRHCGVLFFLRFFSSLYVVVLLLLHEDLNDTGVSDNMPTEALK